MLLKIRTKNVLLVINAENIVYYKVEKAHQQILEISCKNTDVYTFTYQSDLNEKSMKFNTFCEDIINVMISQQELYSCQLDLENIKFEKHSMCSYIDS